MAHSTHDHPPVHKGVINDAAFRSRHTEFSAERTGAPHVLMLLVAGACASRSRPPTCAFGMCQPPYARRLGRTLNTFALIDVAIRDPQTARARRRAHPHAGESGHLGREKSKSSRQPSRLAVARDTTCWALSRLTRCSILAARWS